MQKKEELNVKKILREFREYEESEGHRKGTFKIDVPFDQAVKKIAKAKPAQARHKKRKP